MTVERVIVNPGSTVGIGVGHEEDGTIVVFGGDARMMHAMGEALIESAEPIVVDPPEWAVLLRIRDPMGNGR